MRGRQFANAEKSGTRSGDIAESKKMIERDWIRLTGNSIVREECLYFRSKEETVSTVEVKKRFFPDPVACEKKRTGATVPDRKSEHASQSLQTMAPKFLISVNDHFSITVSAKDVSLLFELLPQLLKVVDLAIEGNPQRAIFVAHGLACRRAEIDNR